MIPVVMTIIGTLMITGLGWLIVGQRNISKDAEKGRSVLHEKMSAALELINKNSTAIDLINQKCELTHKAG